MATIEQLFKDYIVSNLSKLNKEQLIKYVEEAKRTTSKKVLIELLEKKIIEGNVDVNDIYTQDKEIFALTSNQLESLLKVKKSFFTWIKKNRKIAIVRTEEMELYGNVVEVPFWCAKDACNIKCNIERLKILENEFQAEKTTNKKAGTEKAKKTLDKNNILRTTFKNSYDKMCYEWSQQDKEGALYLELAFWTMWASRWAKVYAEKYSKTDNWDHSIVRDEYYKLKAQALKILGCSKFATITIVQPDRPHKVGVDLCDIHKDAYYDECSLHRKKIIDYYYEHEKEISKCNECRVYIEEDYYTLYHIKIEVLGIKDTFSFHIPFEKGKLIFEDKKYLKEIGGHENLEGMFRYGRPLKDDEKVIITESITKKKINNAILHIEEYLKNK